MYLFNVRRKLLRANFVHQNAMASQADQLHFLIVPLMSQSHLLPMTDFATLLARRGPTVTVITTPLNAARFKLTVDRSVKTGLKIHLIPLYFPCQEAGLPEGSENLDTLTSLDLANRFFEASAMLQEPVEKLIAELDPPPSCIVSSNATPWTVEIAQKFGLPRYVFHAISCFTLVCSNRVLNNKVLERENGSSVLLLDMPHEIEYTEAQLPKTMKNGATDRMKKAELSANGILVNSFEELEPMYVNEYRKMIQKTWCVGPVSLSNKNISDKCARGNKASIDEHDCLRWLDSMEPGRVIYACFGSLCKISTPQLVEIGLGLEASKHPFIWTIRGSNCSEEMEEWLEREGFDERNKGRGLVIRGWAPQVLILSHPSVGGFLTHCGWNSSLEGACAGVPMLTWPMFAEQFYNEKFIVEVLEIGVRIGAEVGMKWGDDQMDVLMKRDQVTKGVEQLMDGGEEGEKRRSRARQCADMANRVMEQGGSSYINLHC